MVALILMLILEMGEVEREREGLVEISLLPEDVMLLVECARERECGWETEGD